MQNERDYRDRDSELIIEIVRLRQIKFECKEVFVADFFYQRERQSVQGHWHLSMKQQASYWQRISSSTWLSDWLTDLNLPDDDKTPTNYMKESAAAEDAVGGLEN